MRHYALACGGAPQRRSSAGAAQRVSGRRCGSSAPAPTGEVATLAEANEIRVVFSEPMVTLGRIPARVTAPFFSVTPAIPGSFRWSGTTILIFTPDAKRPLPYATRYDVTIDRQRHRGQRPPARDGPSVQLHDADRQASEHQLVSPRRTRGRADGDAAALQPAGSRRPTLLPHLRRRFQQHDWVRAGALRRRARAARRRSIPSSVQRFNAKVAATRAVAKCDRAGRAVRLTTDWDKKRIPAVTAISSSSRRRRRCRPSRGCGSSVSADGAVAGGPGEAARRSRST